MGSFGELAPMERDKRKMQEEFGAAQRDTLPALGRAQVPMERDETLVSTPRVDTANDEGKLVLPSEIL